MQSFVRLVGFGVVVVPRAPYRIDRMAGAAETTLQVAGSRGDQVVDVRELLGDARDAGPATVVPGRDFREEWRIQTEVSTCAWPAGFGLASDPDGISRFLLLGPSEAMIWIAGPVSPDTAFPIEKLATPDQTIRAVAEATGASRMDVEYLHDDERWWQRRYVVEWGEDGVVVLTGQARLADEEVTRMAVDTVERTLEPTPAEALPS